MKHGPDFVPFSFDLSVLVRRSVATLYSHLVTRPTGRALRLGIESQIGELGAACVSVLDFTQVVVLDYSCADEAVAKLLQRFLAADRPAEAYFVARGLGEQHRPPIEAVLDRHGLALVAEVQGTGFALLGRADPVEQQVWRVVERSGTIADDGVADAIGLERAAAGGALQALVARRLVLPEPSRPGAVRALSTLLSGA